MAQDQSGTGSGLSYVYSVGLSRRENVAEVFSLSERFEGFTPALGYARSKTDRCHWLILRYIPNRVSSGVVIAQSKKDGDNLRGVVQ